MSAGFELLDTHESKAQRDGHIRGLPSHSPAEPLCLK